MRLLTRGKNDLKEIVDVIDWKNKKLVKWLYPLPFTHETNTTLEAIVNWVSLSSHVHFLRRHWTSKLLHSHVNCLTDCAGENDVHIKEKLLVSIVLILILTWGFSWINWHLKLLETIMCDIELGPCECPTGNDKDARGLINRC